MPERQLSRPINRSAGRDDGSLESDLIASEGLGTARALGIERGREAELESRRVGYCEIATSPGAIGEVMIKDTASLLYPGCQGVDIGRDLDIQTNPDTLGAISASSPIVLSQEDAGVSGPHRRRDHVAFRVSELFGNFKPQDVFVERYGNRGVIDGQCRGY